MSPVSALAQWMGRWNVSPAVENTFMMTNKEGPMAILPLEVSTTVGRSYSAARRNGFLEFQERFLDEIAVAIVWLYGVNFMSNLFNKRIKPSIFKQDTHLNPETAWDFMSKKAPSVDLLPSERFTRNAVEKNTLTKIKTLGFFLSVVVATGTAALLIPWLNKKKTELIVRYLDKQEASERAGKNPRWKTFGAVSEAANAKARNQFGPANARSFSGNNTSQSVETLSNTAPFGKVSSNGLGQILPNALVPALKFGFISPEAIQKLGHAVQQTDYGSLLAVDGGLAAGRIAVYGDRSPYEGAEIAFRDIGSLYFYMYSTPHIMRLMAKMLNPALNAEVLLEPKVARRVQQHILQQLLLDNPQRKAQLPERVIKLLQDNDPRALELALAEPDIQSILSKMQLAPGELESAIQGSLKTIPDHVSSHLIQQCTTVDKQRFLPLLDLEAKAYGVEKHLPAFLKQMGSEKITTDSLEILLNKVQKGQAEFSGIDTLERKNLLVAIKQAFRHSVGQRFVLADAKNNVVLQSLAKEIPVNEQAGFWKRLHLMARHDGRDIANSSFRRSLNLGLDASKKVLAQQSEGFIDIGETMANWLEKSVARHQSLGEVAQTAIEDLVADLKQYQQKGLLKQLPGGANEAQQLISELEKAPSNQVGDILNRLSTQLANLKPGKWIRVKNAYMGNSSVADQIDALKTLLSPESQVSCPNSLKVHFDSVSKAQAFSSLDELTSQNLSAYAKTLTELARTAHLNDATIELLTRYQKELYPLLIGEEGRLMALFTTGAKVPLQEKVQELLSGGIQSDSHLIAESLETAGKLKLHSREYNSPKAKEKMVTQIRNWSDRLLSQFDNKALTADALARDIQHFRRLSQSGHIVARVLAAVVSMLGLGVLVPKLQYAITRKLTGKNEHPGIATLHHQDIHTHSWHRHHLSSEFQPRTLTEA